MRTEELRAYLHGGIAYDLDRGMRVGIDVRRVLLTSVDIGGRSIAEPGIGER